MQDPFLGLNHDRGGGLLPVGSEYLLTDDDHVLPMMASQAIPSAHNTITGFSSGAQASGSPASTLVGASSGLQIDLIWDASVKTSASWSAIESAVVSAAQIYTSAFSNHTVLNIDVGLGEVGGTKLGSNDLGESESNAYLTSYATVQSALTTSDAGLVHAGQMSANAVSALVTKKLSPLSDCSAEAKALNLVSPAASSVDGYIGLGTSGLYFPAAGGSIKSSQYDAVGVAAHELSEVMGRIGLEGSNLGSHRDIYTPLDIFRYSAANTPDTTPTAGYFSLNDGATVLDAYNNPANGGDGADWATSSANHLNAYDAYGTPGVITQVTTADLLEVAALGFQVDSGHILGTVTA